MHSLKSVFTSTPSPAQNQKCGAARIRSRRRGRQWCDEQRGGAHASRQKALPLSVALLRAAHAPQHCNTSPFQSGPVFSSCPWPCPSPAPPEVASPPGECESVAPDGAACTSSPASRSRPFVVVDSCGAMGWRKASAHSHSRVKRHTQAVTRLKAHSARAACQAFCRLRCSTRHVRLSKGATRRLHHHTRAEVRYHSLSASPPSPTGTCRHQAPSHSGSPPGGGGTQLSDFEIGSPASCQVCSQVNRRARTRI